MPMFENPCGAYSRYEITKYIPLDRLEAICNAERDGRCVVLPCKVGDRVYCTNTGKIKTDIVTMFVHDGKTRFMLENTGNVHWTVERFGKTVFLTRDEAEAALRKEQSDETHN